MPSNNYMPLTSSQTKFTTRSEFLADGLISLQSSVPGQEEDCPICKDPYVQAVMLPCAHIFDKECITTWLQTDGHDTCPLCKTKLFDTAQEPEPELSHEDQIDLAIQRSGLQVGEHDTFGLAQPYSIEAMLDAASHAAGYLSVDQRSQAGSRVLDTGSGQTLTVAGPAVIDFKSLSLHLIAMANLIRELVYAQERTYTDQQLEDWKLIVQTLLCHLQKKDGKKYDALVLSHGLRHQIKKELISQYIAADAIDFLSGMGESQYFDVVYYDLELLLNYVTWKAWIEQRDRQAVADQEHARGKKRRIGRRGAIAGDRRDCVVM